MSMIAIPDRGIYLASRSPRRRELLAQIGVRYHLLLFRSRAGELPDVPEDSLSGEAPAAYVERMAREKAESGWRRMLQRNLPPAPVLAADTTVSLDGKIYGKPANREHAADMLAALSILLGKPFVVGDFIDAQGMMGTVESVGLRSTRMRTLSGDELIFPNKKLLEGTIRNYTRMPERRVDFRIGVTYDTPPAKLERIPGIARDAVQRHPLVRFDRSHFRAMRDWSLEFDVIYFVASSDFAVYADIQQQINLELMRRFEAEGIGFAFPTQVVEVKGPRIED